MRFVDRHRWAGVLALCLAALPGGSCTDFVRGAPPDSTITVNINPTFVVAHGGMALVTAIVIEDNTGTPVSDGSVVQFFTDLGRIDEQAKTKNGIARANFVADSRSGFAKITVLSGGAVLDACSADCIISVGSARPVSVVVAADPQGLRPGQTSYITVNVFDEFGNPVANVPIVLTITSPEGRDSLASGGRQIFTDSNGQTFDQFHAGPASSSRSVTVQASAAGVDSGPVVIRVVP